MSETSSSDDFSDIDYAQNKNINENISDVESFEDFSPSSNSKPNLHHNPQNDSHYNMNKRGREDHSDPNDSFGSDQFEAEHGDDDIHDDEEDDMSSKPEMSNNMNRNNHMNTMQGNDITPKNNINGNNNKMKNNDLYYNPRDYDSLNVNNEIRRLFEYIERFKYNEIELETQLKPFIPDYIPSIGNVDSFIKPTRTTTNYDKEENNEKLGIHYLDEPILNQSDPSTFYLKLSNESKQVSMNKHSKISYIVDAEKNANKIRNWIDNFKRIKSKSLANNVNIDNLNNMPKIEELMQPFIDERFNEYIKDKENQEMDIIPSYHIDLTLHEYAKIICNILDIPIQSDDDINTSLHLLFSTYAALQSTSNDS